MEYPQRPKLFVLRVIDQMLAEDLAASAGHDVCWLLLAIVRAEDRFGYTKPVEFFNERLVMHAGLRSVGHLRRVRDVAIKLGWLGYTEGGRRRPGKYHLIDRSGNDLGQEPHSKPDDTPHSKPDEKPTKKAHKKPRAELTRNPTPSSLFPDPNPLPSPSETSSLRSEVSCEHSPDGGNGMPKPAGEEKKPRPRNELFDAVADVCGADPTLNGSQVGKAAADLAKAGYTPADVRAFAARLIEFCPGRVGGLGDPSGSGWMCGRSLSPARPEPPAGRDDGGGRRVR